MYCELYLFVSISTLFIIYSPSLCLFSKAKGLQKTKAISNINSNHHHISCSIFFSKVTCHVIIICGCEKVLSVEEALPQPGGGLCHSEIGFD